MAISPAAVAYATVGGLVLFSGIKNTTLTNTVKGALAGNLNNIPGGASPSLTDALTLTNTSSDQFGGGNLDTPGTAAANSSAAQNQALAKKLAIQMGHADWTTGQAWNDWVKLWNQESGWSATAENKSSGAYGIPQALPPTKLPAAGQKSGGSHPDAQIAWGIDYIAGRYGSPVMAWAHEVANNWY